MSEDNDFEIGSTSKELVNTWLTQIGIHGAQYGDLIGIKASDAEELVQMTQADAMNNSRIVKEYVEYHCALAVNAALADAAARIREIANDRAWTTEEVNDIVDHLDALRPVSEDPRGLLVDRLAYLKGLQDALVATRISASGRGPDPLDPVAAIEDLINRVTPTF